MKRQQQAYVYAILAVLLWSTVASAFKIALGYVDFLQLLFYASLVSVITLFIVLLAQRKLALLKKTTRQDLVHSAFLGFLNPFLYYVVLFKAYSLLPAQEAQPLNYTWPIMLVLLSIPLLGQRISLKSLLAILISFVGVLIIGTQGNLLHLAFTNLGGDLLALGSSIIWALFWIYNLKDKRDETTKLFLNFAFGLVYVSAAMLFFSDALLPSMPAILAISYVGLFEMGVTFVLWSKALKHSATIAKVSNFIYFTPFISLVFIHFIVGEDILPSTIIGLIFIVGGVLLQHTVSRRKV